MHIRFSGRYKSIGPFTWDDIPEFVVLTGVNGSGKTQLLELCERALPKTAPDVLKKSFATDFIVEQNQVLRLAASWNELVDPEAEGLQDIQHETVGLWSQFEAWRHEKTNLRSRRQYHDTFTNICAGLKKSPESIERNEFIQNLPLKIFQERGDIFNSGFGRACLRFHYRAIAARAQGMSNDQVEMRYGQPPWGQLNEILKISGMQYRVNAPTDFELIDKFKCELRNCNTNEVIPFSQLSSGEQVVVSLVFWLFNSDNPGVFPKVLLLDEPDAHLHPAMTRQFLDVVQNGIVGRLGTRVIMTSHSPSTIALAPDDALWEMRREEPRLRSICKTDAIDLLTAGLVVIRPGIRFVLVEDRDDVEFYSDTDSELRGSDSRTSEPGVAFVHCGRTNGLHSSGGRREVEKWVPRLLEAGLGEIRGLVVTSVDFLYQGL